MKKVLVTGGAGYIGSVLTRMLLNEGYQVHVLDKLNFGGDSLVECFNFESFSFSAGDLRDSEVAKKAVKDSDAIVHLASIVGDPACAKEPDLARSTNVDGSKALYEVANQAGVSQFIFASTCSNYGKMADPNQFVDEDSPLSPVSLYAETKVAVEEFLMSQPKSNRCQPVSLRFSTVYGLSPRVRFDLTVNEFTKELALGRELVVFGEQFWRPYCHVVDLARSVISVLEADSCRVDRQVFNVGATDQNYRKQDLVDEIKKFLPEAKIKYVKKDEDPRDYRVSFEKISQQLDFKISKTVPDGISQIVDVVQNGMIKDPDDPKFKNVV